MKFNKCVLLILIYFIKSIIVHAQKYYSFELHGGTAYNVPLPLTIKQKGYDDIYIPAAKFYSESFIRPYYWDWRFCKHINKHSIEFEAIHHKLYLETNHPDIQRFGISHGFNILTFNYGRKYKNFIFRNGLGSVLMHPESTIRNKVYPEGPGFDIKGYRLRGVVFNTAIGYKILFCKKRFFINTELKATFAKGNVPIVDGIAKLNNIALQAISGLGVNFAGKKNLHENKH